MAKSSEKSFGKEFAKGVTVVALGLIALSALSALSAFVAEA